jgi:hypothetical protein
MINLQLKAKHYYLIAADLFKLAAASSFKTLEKIKTGCDGLDDNDLVFIETRIEELIPVFTRLAQKPEGSYNNINTEMLDLLLPQITAGVSANDPEWIKLGERITTIRTDNLKVVEAEILNGKNALYN